MLQIFSVIDMCTKKKINVSNDISLKNHSKMTFKSNFIVYYKKNYVNI